MHWNLKQQVATLRSYLYNKNANVSGKTYCTKSDKPFKVKHRFKRGFKKDQNTSNFISSKMLFDFVSFFAVTSSSISLSTYEESESLSRRFSSWDKGSVSSSEVSCGEFTLIVTMSSAWILWYSQLHLYFSLEGGSLTMSGDTGEIDGKVFVSLWKWLIWYWVCFDFIRRTLLTWHMKLWWDEDDGWLKAASSTTSLKANNPSSTIWIKEINSELDIYFGKCSCRLLFISIVLETSSMFLIMIGINFLGKCYLLSSLSWFCFIFDFNVWYY